MTSSNRRVIVQIVATDSTGDSLHRMHWPALQVAAQSPEWLVINLEASAIERFSWGEAADLLVIYQSCDLELLRVIKRRRERGLKTIVEYNDNFYAPPPSSPAFKDWNSVVIQSAYEEFMKAADAVMTTSDTLSKLFTAKVDTPCVAIRNFLPFTPASLDQLLEAKAQELSLVWAGSIGHAADLIATLPTLRTFLERHKECKLFAMGNEALPGVLRIPPSQLHFEKWADMTSYFTLLRHGHIGIVPLLATSYNSCRSDVKAIEMIGSGVLPLLAAAPPYADVVAETGLPTWETFDELNSLLEKFYSEPQTLKSYLDRALTYVKEKRLAGSDTTRVRLYESLCPQTAESSGVQWPKELGFIAVKGTPHLQPLWLDLERSLRAKLRRGDVQDGLSTVQQLTSDFDGHPTVALGCLNALYDFKFTDDAERLRERFQARYPRDIRFRAALVTHAATSSEYKMAWQELLGIIYKWSEEEKVGWTSFIIDLWRSDERCAGFPDIARQLEQLFPENLSLAAHNAQLLLLSNDPAATSRCEELARKYELIQNNESFKAEFTAGYWHSFAAGNEGNRRGKLGWRQ